MPDIYTTIGLIGIGALVCAVLFFWIWVRDLRRELARLRHTHHTNAGLETAQFQLGSARYLIETLVGMHFSLSTIEKNGDPQQVATVKASIRSLWTQIASRMEKAQDALVEVGSGPYAYRDRSEFPPGPLEGEE